MTPSRPLPLESTMVWDPAASFICQMATGRSMAALAGAASASTPASVIETVSMLRRTCAPRAEMRCPAPTPGRQTLAPTEGREAMQP
jgi:hypothetical protein